MAKINLARKSIFDDLDKDGNDDNEYPFDDGWKCSIF